MSHVTKVPEQAEQVPSFRTRPVYIGEFWPTDKPFEAVATSGSRLASLAMESGWESLPTVKRLGLPFPKGLDHGLEVVEKTELLTDHTGEVQRMNQVVSSIARSNEPLAESIVEFSRPYDAQDIQCNETNENELRERAREFVAKVPAFRTVINPEAKAAELALGVATLNRFAIGIEAKMDNGQLIQVANQNAQLIQEEKDQESNSLCDEVSNHSYALNGLRAVCELAGPGATSGWIVNVRDRHELLGSQLSKFAKLLRKLKQPYYDLVIMDPLFGSTGFLRAAGEELVRTLQCSVWASLATSSEEDMIRYAAENPAVGSIGAGSVFTFVGNALYKGRGVVPSATVFGNRLALDLNLQGQLLSHWGPQSNKGLSHVTSDTTDWDEETLVMLAKESGLNALFSYNNGIVSPYAGRTLSSLPDYRMADEGRTASMLEGFVSEYLSLNAISEPCEAARIRAICERAESIYVEPFIKSHPGFHGSVTPAAQIGSDARIDITIRANDPIERLIITRRGGRSVAA